MQKYLEEKEKSHYPEEKEKKETKKEKDYDLEK